MNTHKEPNDKYIVARENVLAILIDEYKQNCNYDALMRIMTVVEEYGGSVEPTPPSQIEEEPRIGATLELLATQRGKLLEALVDTSYVYTDSKQARVVYLEEIKKIDELMLALNNTK